MISRRNIRVKVMQTLYTLHTLETKDGKPADPQKILQNHFDQSRALFFYLTWFLTEVARYAEKDAHTRASKHLPSADDLKVNTKIAGNELLWKILEDPAFVALGKIHKPQHIQDSELIKKIYYQLKETPEYRKYIASQERDRKEEKDILMHILITLMLPSEVFVGHIEENFSNWDDDAEMVVQILENYLQKPGSINIMETISPDKLEFAKGLLRTVLEKEEYLQSLIIPRLKNWDPDRIAQLDMILMKMGVCEFLYFETIPPKVTINEYIDLAKEYSTQQSGQFVNGILDNIHKDLVSSGKMNKVEFKKA